MIILLIISLLFNLFGFLKATQLIGNFMYGYLAVAVLKLVASI